MNCLLFYPRIHLWAKFYPDPFSRFYVNELQTSIQTFAKIIFVKCILYAMPKSQTNVIAPSQQLGKPFVHYVYSVLEYWHYPLAFELAII